MEIIHTRNRAVAWGVLLSALVVGVVLTLGQVPLAVSQPVTIQAKMIKGPIPMDGANPVWENVPGVVVPLTGRSEEHTSELQSRLHLVCRLLLEKKKNQIMTAAISV